MVIEEGEDIVEALKVLYLGLIQDEVLMQQHLYFTLIGFSLPCLCPLDVYMNLMLFLFTELFHWLSLYMVTLTGF